MRYPEKGGSDIEIERISSNGRYLAARVDLGPYQPIRTIFFDLKNKTQWVGEEDYGIWEIGNDGIAKVGSLKQNKVIYIDLKPLLGGGK
ncbi:MAG: hypothetical protein AB1397_03960 [bacterium]